MNLNPTLAELSVAVRKLFSARDGNVATMFGIAAIPVMGAMGVAVDYTHANSIKAAMQSALDSAALALVQTADSITTDQLTASVGNYFNANFNRPEVKNLQISSNYDTSSGILSVTGSATMPTSFAGMIGMSTINVGGLSKATKAGKIWPVCVLITNSTDKHTLLTANTAQLTFNNCMVQVNTIDWDAVEARNTSYIHSTNGENCFVGDIHYGDVQPPKDPSCSFFPDPFAGMAMPASAATCNQTNFTTTASGVTLQPGTYCGNTVLNGGNITLAPGLYIIKAGNFTIGGNSNIIANGVTFVLTGTGPNIYVTNNAELTLTPMTSGPFAGFAMYLDNNSNMTACDKATDGAKFTGGDGGKKKPVTA